MRRSNRKEEATHVIICDVRLGLPPLDSLKGKRSIAKSIIERVRNRFNVAIAEVRYLDSKDLLGLAIVSVGNARSAVDAVLSQVVLFLEEDRRFTVDDISTTVI